MLYPCVSLHLASSRLNRSGQTKSLAIGYSAISRDNGWSIPFYPDLPVEVNFHKRIQISRPRRNYPRVGAAWWNFRFGVLNSRASLSPLRLSAFPSVDRNRRVPYFCTIDLARFDVGPCIIQRFLLSSQAFVFSLYIHRMLNIQDDTLNPGRHVIRSTTCTTDTALIISVNCAPRDDRFFHG